MHLGCVHIVLRRVIPVNTVNFQLKTGIWWFARAFRFNTVRAERM